MRIGFFAGLLVMSVLGEAHAQATVFVRVVERDGRESPGFIAVSVPAQGIQRLTNESGTIVLRDLQPGRIALRFRRIGFAAKDTVITVGANDTARISVEMERIAIQLPTVLVNGTCTDRTPFEHRGPILSELLDQMKQNAERFVLLAKERPFTIQVAEERGPRGRGVAPQSLAYSRGPLPDQRYVPKRVLQFRNNVGYVTLPELADLADTAFTNNHCFTYAGKAPFGADSVLRIDFEPVPWLAKEVDLAGSLYLRADDYRLVEIVTHVTGMPRNVGPAAHGALARFRELVSGIPILTQSETTNTFRGSREPVVVSTVRVTGVTWLVPTKRDSLRQ
jgi:hypothetical protein